MSRKIFAAALFFFSCLVSVPAETESPRNEIWAEALSALSRSNPSDAVAALERIMPLAAAEESWSEYALAAEIRAAELAEAAGTDSADARIRALRQAVEETPAPEAKILLEARLARAFASLTNDGYISKKNTANGGNAGEPTAVPENLADWSDEQLRDAAFAHCENMLAQQEFLKKIPIGNIRSLFAVRFESAGLYQYTTGGNFSGEKRIPSETPGAFSLFGTPEAELPTLYDFLAQDAVSLYLYFARYQLKRHPDAETLLTGTRKFRNLVPALNGSSPEIARIIQIFQERERFHADDADKTALAAAVLDRISTVALVAANRSKPSSQDGLSFIEMSISEPDFPAASFERALRNFIAEYAALPISAKASAMLARVCAKTNREPEAFELASRALEKFGNTPYAPECENVLNFLKRRTLSVSSLTRSRNSWLSSAPTKIDIKAKNLSHVRIRAVPADRNSFLARSPNFFFSCEENSALHDSENAVELTLPLEKFEDFREHQYEIEIPAGTLAPGFYFVFFAADDEPFFKSILPVCVSDIAVITQKSVFGDTNTALVGSDGTLPLRVVNAATGTPIEGAEISVWQRTGNRIEKCADIVAEKTDALGETVVSGLKKGEFSAVLAERAFPAERGDAAENGTENAAETQTHATVLLRFYHAEEKPQPKAVLPEYRISLFTDAKEFRPGQNIHFKGIFSKRVKPKNSAPEIFPEKKVRITLTDSAGTRTIAETKTLSGERGSFAGTLAIPRDAELGKARLTAECEGCTPVIDPIIRIAEFRRPKFFMEIRDSEKPEILGGTASAAISGKTAAGTPLAGAKVRWNVRESVSSGPILAQGESTLGDDGTLRVSWETSRKTLKNSESLRKSLTEARFQNLESQQVVQFFVNAEISADGETKTAEKHISHSNVNRSLSLYRSLPQLSDNSFPILLAGTDLPVVCDISEKFRNQNPETLSEVRIDVFRLVEPESAKHMQEKKHAFDGIPELPSGENVFSIKTVTGKKDENGKLLPACIVPAQKIPPGRYRIRACGRDDFEQEIFDEFGFAVIDPDAKTTPIRQKMMFERVPPESVREVGESADFIYASALKNARAFVEICESKSRERLAAFYVAPESGQQKISVPVTEAMRGKSFSVKAVQIAESEILVKRLSLHVPAKKQEKEATPSAPKGLRIKPLSMNRSLVPGTEETWTFEITREDGSPASGAEALVMLRETAEWDESDLSPPWILSSGGNADVFMRRTFLDEKQCASSLYKFSNSFYLSETVRERDAAQAHSDKRNFRPAPPDWTFQWKIPQIQRRSEKATPKSTAKTETRIRFPGETIFFRPFLRADENGVLTVRFTVPAVFPRWKFYVSALDEYSRTGSFSAKNPAEK